jgi:hypothetical protein
LLLVGLGAWQGGAVSRETDATIDKRTFAFVTRARECVFAVEVVELAMQNKLVSLVTENAFQARATCDAVRHQLLRVDSEHFSDPAGDVVSAIDRYRRGLHTLADYIESGVPATYNESRDRFKQASASIVRGISDINERRRDFGFDPLGA